MSSIIIQWNIPLWHDPPDLVALHFLKQINEKEVVLMPSICLCWQFQCAMTDLGNSPTGKALQLLAKSSLNSLSASDASWKHLTQRRRISWEAPPCIWLGKWRRYIWQSKKKHECAVIAMLPHLKSKLLFFSDHHKHLYPSQSFFLSVIVLPAARCVSEDRTGLERRKRRNRFRRLSHNTRLLRRKRRPQDQSWGASRKHLRWFGWRRWRWRGKRRRRRRWWWSRTGPNRFLCTFERK